jgi:predicted RND superfamily exporter protein
MGNQYAAGGAPNTSGEATAAMICGIIGLFFFGIILGPIAICLGVSAKNKIKQNPEALTGECQATAGIVMGSIAVALWVIILIYVIAGGGSS